MSLAGIHLTATLEAIPVTKAGDTRCGRQSEHHDMTAAQVPRRSSGDFVGNESGRVPNLLRNPASPTTSAEPATEAPALSTVAPTTRPAPTKAVPTAGIACHRPLTTGPSILQVAGSNPSRTHPAVRLDVAPHRSVGDHGGPSSSSGRAARVNSSAAHVLNGAPSDSVPRRGSLGGRTTKVRHPVGDGSAERTSGGQLWCRCRSTRISSG